MVRREEVLAALLLLAAASRSAARKSCAACRFNQNSGEFPKYRASRSAVSAVTPPLPLTMSFTRVART